MIKSESEIGARIAQIRGHRSRPQFAKEMGIHKSTLVRYETGESSVNGEFIAALVARGYDANWLLSGEGSEHLDDDQALSADGSGHASPSAHRINRNILFDVARQLETLIERHNEEWTFQEMLDFVAGAYDAEIEHGERLLEMYQRKRKEHAKAS